MHANHILRLMSTSLVAAPSAFITNFHAHIYRYDDQMARVIPALPIFRPRSSTRRRSATRKILCQADDTKQDRYKPGSSVNA
jgi:hypothetical protein